MIISDKELYHVVVICPNCNLESFDITVTNSGQGFDGERTVHCFEGEGFCDECGHTDWYGDSD